MSNNKKSNDTSCPQPGHSSARRGLLRDWMLAVALLGILFAFLATFIVGLLDPGIMQ